jgi:hypothetical protein
LQTKLIVRDSDPHVFTYNIGLEELIYISFW